MRQLDVIILAAGSGRRLQAALGVAKQFAMLRGKPVWQHAVDSLSAHASIGKILITLPANTPIPEGLSPDVICVEGGILRQDSVHNALQYLDSLSDCAPFVAIHDSARPFIPHSVIDRLLDALEAGAQAVIPALPVADTMKRARGNLVEATISRDSLRAVQTPQAFDRPMITKLHAALNAAPEAVTDDASLAENAGIDVQIVEGDVALHKLTLPEDFIMANEQGSANIQPCQANETRIGTGYDVHKFKTGSGPVAICGLEVAHDKSIEAHSDGDVGLHALCDAIFGALGDGDIGQHFPPSDAKWKDAASDQFLEFALQRLEMRGGKIINMDVTIICETPKIGPLRDKMRAKIAEIASINMSRVSVKATTSERLGFTGRGEGIAAMASVSLSLPINEDK